MQWPWHTQGDENDFWVPERWDTVRSWLREVTRRSHQRYRHYWRKDLWRSIDGNGSPEPGTVCWVYRGEGDETIELAIYRAEPRRGWQGFASWEQESGSVTHWWPLAPPSPPQYMRRMILARRER